MARITAIEICNFRSLQQVSLDELAAANIIAGRNHSGKSNILRALNLFFNDEVDPGNNLKLSLDHYRPWRKKKLISIAVKFDLRSKFTYGKRYKSAESLLGQEPFIERTWSYEDREVVSKFLIFDSIKKEFKPLGESDARTVRSFLSLFKYRYIPNHVHPSEMIAEEQT